MARSVSCSGLRLRRESSEVLIRSLIDARSRGALNRVREKPAAIACPAQALRFAAALITVGAIASASLIACLPGEWWWRATVAVAIGAYGFWLLRSHAYAAMRRSHAYAAMRRSIVSIEVGADLRATFTERGGRGVEGTLQHGSYVGAMLTTIVLRPAGSRRTRAIAIFPDMLNQRDFRRLRTLLRLGRLAE